MINAGTVAAYLTLDTSDFVKGMTSAGQMLTDFRRQQSDGFGGLDMTLGALGAALLRKVSGWVGALSGSSMLGGLPSLLREKGIAGIQGLIAGVNGQRGAASSAVSAVVGAMRSSAGAVSFTSVGSGIVSGILSGMNGRRSSLMTAARGLAAGVSGVIRSALRINSPSKVMMEIGEFTAAGMELGLTKGAVRLYDTASHISRETAEVLAGASLADGPGRSGAAYVGMTAADSGNRLERLIDAVERLAAAESTVEIDGRPFGRLVREYV